MKTLHTLIPILLAFLSITLGASEIAAQPIKIDRSSVDSLLKESFKLSELNKFDEAEELAVKSIEINKHIGDSGLFSRSYIQLGEIHFFKRNLGRAEDYASEARAYCAQSCDTTTMIKIAGVLGGIYNLQGRFNQSVQNYEESLKLCQLSNRDDYYIDLLFNMTSTLGALGRYEEMLSALIKCQEYYEKEGNTTKLATIYNNLGLAYSEHFKDNKIALKNFRKAIKLDKKDNNLWNLSRDYHNLALVFMTEGEYDSANYYLNESIRIKSEMGDEGGLSQLYHSKGQLLLKTGEFEGAREFFLRGKEIVEKYSINEGLYYTNLGLGLTSDSTGQHSEALNFYKQALAFARKGGSNEHIHDALEHIYRHHKAVGQYEDALEAFEEVQNYHDSISAQLQDEKLLELKASYQAELHEKENALLRAEREKQQVTLEQSETKTWIFVLAAIIFLLIAFFLLIAYRSRNNAYNTVKDQKRELEQMNDKLEEKSNELNEINSSKDRLFSVISHDLRGPLASLESCLEILITEELGAEERDSLIRDLRLETRNTLKTLDDLLAWSKVQMSGMVINKENFVLNNLVKEVCELYLPLAKHKNVEINFGNSEEEHAVYADPYQIKTVLRNLLSNAVKFTPKDGDVSINLTRDRDDLIVSISDEGKGIPAEDIQKIKDPNNYFSSRGTNDEKGTGVGLILSMEFLKAHGSELLLEKNDPSGTRASFSLSLAKVPA